MIYFRLTHNPKLNYKIEKNKIVFTNNDQFKLYEFMEESTHRRDT